MNAFEVKITPTRLKVAKKLSGREPTQLVFAPFSAKAIITFEDVPLGKTARRLLFLVNPSNEDIKVTVTKNLRPEFNIDLEWTSNKITANNQVQMEIVWSPTKVFSCKETLQFTDSRNFKKDVTIILKSFSTKAKKRPLVGVTNNKMPKITIKSPSPVLRPRQNTPPHLRHTATVSHEIYSKQNKFDAFCLNQPKREALEKPEFCKENLSPNSPGISCYDQCLTTPSDQKTIDYLASLPTPVTDFESVQNKTQNRPECVVKPRQLYNFLAAGDSPKESKKNKNLFSAGQNHRHIDVVFKTEVYSYSENDEMHEVIELPVIKLSTPDKSSQETCVHWNTNQNNTEDKAQIINKTFDLKSRNQENSFNNMSISPAKTETVEFCVQTEYRQIQNLITIEEETTEETTTKLEKTFDVGKDVKRDIRLIATPLAKCSESLQDLSRCSNPRTSCCMMGSLPNLNNMENINPIDENRYYRKDEADTCHDVSKCSTVSTISITHNMPDIFFNQSEILAQSSRLNINDVDRKRSPNSKRFVVPRSPKEFGKRGRELSLDNVESSNYLQVEYANHQTSLAISPPKRTKLDEKESFQKTPSRRSPRSSRSALSSWARTKPKIKLEKTLSSMKTIGTPRKTRPAEPIVRLYNTELYLQSYINPDPFAATTTCDPFLTATMYLDERSVNSHEEQFKKWLNALVSIPAEFDSDCNQKIDVGRLFNEVRNKDISVAPTKEQQSMNYLTKSRMNSLRTAAVHLFMSPEMREPCTKVAVHINKGSIKIRSDRDLHLDVVMQRQILELLLCFNPLWLRIGLEAVFGEIIYMNSNADIVGLSTFIINRLFRDKLKEQKYNRAYMLSSEYSEYIKKFTLQKVLFLLLFLDKAKNKKIIKHNPCLFVRKSPYKETKEILLRFSSELLANIGDVTKGLRRFGYFLAHKQTFLDEFNYAFTNLAVDLRDGIRLTRVMEIILLRDNLTTQLRVPAISRLQRVFNVNLALKALAESDFVLNGDIAAADIVDGHREKTLSLLWQIIYKFRSPKFHASATVIQKWWRNSWLKVFVRRRIRHKEEMRRKRAATMIQSHFRAFRSRRYLRLYRAVCTKAAVCLQKYVRGYLARKHLRNTLEKIVKIQRWYRSVLITRKVRMEYIEQKRSAVIIQRWYRRQLLANKIQKAAIVIRTVKEEAKLRYDKAVVIQRVVRSYSIRCRFIRLVHQVVQVHKYSVLQHKSATKIQSLFRMFYDRQQYVKLKNATKVIQQKWRDHKLAKVTRQEYLRKRGAALAIQKHYRLRQKMVEDRTHYQTLRKSVICVQQRFRGKLLTIKLRSEYHRIYNKIVYIQKYVRATLMMRRQRTDYLHLKQTVIKIQQRFRANKDSRLQAARYQQLRHAAVFVQSKFRGRRERTKYLLQKESSVKIQRKLRATLLMRKVRLEFITLQYHTIIVQQRFRAIREMRKCRQEYSNLRLATMSIQRRWRATIKMKQSLVEYQTLRKACIIIQQRLRSTLIMKIEQARFKGKRQAAACIQEWFRGCMERNRCRNLFVSQKRAALVIQRYVRGYFKMKACKSEYLKMRHAALTLQTHYRNYRQMIITRNKFLEYKRCVLVIQRRFRANQIMKEEYRNFVVMKKATIVIQERFRAQLQMKRVREDYCQLRKAAVITQSRFRAMREMKKNRAEYVRLRNAAKYIQAKFRARISMQVQKKEYDRLRSASVCIQTRYRALIDCRQMRSQYLELKNAAVVIQRRYRAIKITRQVLQSYQEKRVCIVKIQRFIKSYILTKRQRERFLLLKKSTLIIQRRYRATQQMHRQRIIYLTTVERIRLIQILIRATLQMRIERNKFILLKQTTITVQRRFRSIYYMKQERNHYLKMRNAAIVIQRRYRAYRSMCECQEQYRKLRQCVTVLQQKFKAKLLMRRERRRYLELRSSTIFLQQTLRSKLLCRRAQQKYFIIRKTVLGLQSRIRGYLARKRFEIMMSPEMLEARKRQRAAVIIQSLWRGYRVRKMFTSSKITTLRANIKRLKKSSTYSNTLKYKLMASMQFLKDRFNIQEAFHYVKSLERTSRVLPHMLVDHARFVSSVCYAIMAQAIRSEADKHIIEVCSRIILNLARFGPTKAAVFQENGFVTIAQMLIRWCDKESGIFNTLCTLMWVFAHSVVRRNKIREFLTSTEAIYLLRETKKLVVRKERMRQNVRKVGTQSQVTSSPTQRRALPSLQPDYGVARTKPYTFVCSVFALDTVLNKLEVKI